MMNYHTGYKIVSASSLHELQDAVRGMLELPGSRWEVTGNAVHMPASVTPSGLVRRHESFYQTMVQTALDPL